MNEVYVSAACRTPIGRFGGALSVLTAGELGAMAIKDALRRAGGVDCVDEVVMGNVIQAGQGQNPARQAALKAGLPETVPCLTVNKVCGSGMKAVVMAAQAIKAGDAAVVVAGGMEAMSRVPYALARPPGVFGDLTLADLILRDGLTDAFDGRHMALMAEKLAARFGISREAQDVYAERSQRLCRGAQEAGKFRDEIVPAPVKTRKGETICAQDEHPRPETTLAVLSKLRPAFDPQGTITAGNASGMNDGAAALVLASGACVREKQLPVLGKVLGWASAALAPELFGIAPAAAVRMALARAGLTLEDVGVIEANEAFAAQTLALAQAVKWKDEIVNVNGGAIALGHPIGASGARILVTLLYEMQRRRVKYGLATLCIGGGMGIAMVVEAA